MLYTTYFNKINQLPDDTIKLIITRFPPKWFDIKKYKNTYLCKALAPSKEILLKYKQDNNWQEYESAFLRQMLKDETTRNALAKLKNGLKNGNNYALICYERNYIRCHRYLIAQRLVSEDIEWKEI